MSLASHLIIAPILLPLLVGGLMLVFDNRKLVAGLGVVSTFAVLAIAIVLMQRVETGNGPESIVYLLGNWPVQFGIVLVADRLSGMMLVLTGVLACAALTYSLARWHRQGAYFHPLFQFLLAGLNGAFLTGDLFNLFVFFELMLAASYGLALHGSGSARVRYGLHYIAINLTSAFAFLIGVALIYGATGTLNMAEIAVRVPQLAGSERALFAAGAAIFGVVFLVKAAIWPLGFWLPNIYAAVAAPVAAIFAIMTKVGIYGVLRVGGLMSTGEDGGTFLFGNGWLLAGGAATVLFAATGMIAAQGLPRLAAFSVIGTSGTLIAVIGIGDATATAGALFYLVSSTLSISAFFLLIELVDRGRLPADDILAVTLEAYGDDEDIDEEEAVGVAVPAVMALLGASFMACALLLAGMPPFSGFIAKFVMIAAALNPAPGSTGGTFSDWLVIGILLVLGLATLIAMTRAGIRSFWVSIDRDIPSVKVIEFAPIALLLVLSLALTVMAGPAMRILQETSEGLYAPQAYMKSVLSAAPRQPQGGSP